MKKHITIEHLSFLSFFIGNEQFAIPVGQVIEVLQGQKLTGVPKTADYIEGIVNFRGNILTVIDTKKKIHLANETESKKFVIIVFTLEFNGKKVTVGAKVDRVKNVFSIPENEIKPVPDFGSYYNPEYLKGAIKINDQFIMILDITRILSHEEVNIIQETNESIKNNG